VFTGPSGANHRKGGIPLALGVGERALCKIEKGRDGIWRARAIPKVERDAETSLIGVCPRQPSWRHGRADFAAKEKSEFIVERSDAKDATDGDLVRIQARPARGYGPRPRQRDRDSRPSGRSPRGLRCIAMHTAWRAG